MTQMDFTSIVKARPVECIRNHSHWISRKFIDSEFKMFLVTSGDF
jgi:hypothetical protein